MNILDKMRESEARQEALESEIAKLAEAVKERELELEEAKKILEEKALELNVEKEKYSLVREYIDYMESQRDQELEEIRLKAENAEAVQKDKTKRALDTIRDEYETEAEIQEDTFRRAYGIGGVVLEEPLSETA